MTEHRMLTWDWRGQPDLVTLADAIRELSDGRLHLYEVGTGGDEYAIVLATAALPPAEVQRLFDGTPELAVTPTRVALLKAAAAGELWRPAGGVDDYLSPPGQLGKVTDRKVTARVAELEHAAWIYLGRGHGGVGRDWCPTHLGFLLLAQHVPGWDDVNEGQPLAPPATGRTDLEEAPGA